MAGQQAPERAKNMYQEKTSDLISSMKMYRITRACQRFSGFGDFPWEGLHG